MTSPEPHLSPAQIAALPPTVDVATAGQLLGISRSTAYKLAATNELPVPVLTVGHSLRIPTAPLLDLLGLTPSAPAPPGRGDGDGAETGRSANDREA
jgi:hypothetical protein